METFILENYEGVEEEDIPEEVIGEFKGYYHDLMKISYPLS